MFGHGGKGAHHGHHGQHHPHDPLSVPAEVINSVDSGDLNRVFLTSGQLNSEAIVEVGGRVQRGVGEGGGAGRRGEEWGGAGPAAASGHASFDQWVSLAAL
jgi:hypothetical protein